MNKKIFILPLVLSAGLLSLTACGDSGPNRSGKELFITVYDGGYGTDWIKQVAKDYQAKTGIKVNWDANQSLLDILDSELEYPESDIYMSHDIRWQEYAEAGLIEQLDDLYNSEVEGTGKTFKQRLCAGAEEVSRLDDGHYYKVCYTQGAGGLVYNIDMFEENGWSVPTTYDELVTLCQTIVNARIPTEELTNVVPIAWAGKDREYYWDYIVFEWWAQLAGMDGINKFKAFLGDNGKYSTGYEVFNPQTNHKEFVQAYEKWYNLIAVSDNHKFSNSTPQDTMLVEANSLFASGGAAMIPYAQWAKYEIQENTKIKLDFDIAMMKTPKINSSVSDYNYNVGFGDSMIIPSNIPEESKELAKDFLRYLAGKEACKTFVDKARGAFLAFDYSIVDLGELLNDTYIASVYRKLTETQCFNLTSTNPVAYINQFVMPWVGNTYYYAKAFSAPGNSAYQPTAVGNTVYSDAIKNWSGWVHTAGLDGK